MAGTTRTPAGTWALTSTRLADELQRKREQREIAETQRDARNLVEAVAKSGGSQMLLDALAKAEARLAELIANQTQKTTRNSWTSHRYAHG